MAQNIDFEDIKKLRNLAVSIEEAAVEVLNCVNAEEPLVKETGSKPFEDSYVGFKNTLESFKTHTIASTVEIVELAMKQHQNLEIKMGH